MSGDGAEDTGNSSGNPIGEAGIGFGEDAAGGRWLSYAELAEIRGIGRESAVKLVQRERWRRMPSNDRTIRVLVPAEWLKPAAKGDRIGEADPAAFGEETTQDFGEAAAKFGELASLVNALQDAVSLVREREEAAEARADQAEVGRRTAEARADAERARADQAETDRRTAEARADRAGQALDCERATVNTLRDRLAAEEAARHQARAEAQAAQDALAALRQAEADRKARGLLARLRAAVRGE
jgi:hypothetical protein